MYLIKIFMILIPYPIKIFYCIDLIFPKFKAIRSAQYDLRLKIIILRKIYIFLYSNFKIFCQKACNSIDII